MNRSRARKAASRRLALARSRQEPCDACAPPLVETDAADQPEVVESVGLLEPPAPEPIEQPDTPAPAFDPLADDEEPPFDPPDEDDDIFRVRLEEFDAEGDEGTDGAPRAPAREPVRPGDMPVPPIAVCAFWDRPELATLLHDLAAHRLMARAEFSIERGGLDAATVGLAQATPDLVLIDTTLSRPEILRGLDQIAPVMARGAKVIVLGAVNDIMLLRELAARGVSHYIVAPLKLDEIVRCVCGLYATADTARVIAVIGARGGVGASSLAQNLAWSMAERHDADTALLDLDLAFGTAAFQLQQEPPYSLADILLAPKDIDDAFLERVTSHRSQRLRMLSAPAKLANDIAVTPESVELVIGCVRRTTSFVVLDLPHDWNSWVKKALAAADEVLIVAEPELTCLRNAKNMLDALAPVRSGKSTPAVVLSMAGVPKRPEIALKEFADAIGADPIASLPFDPDAFGLAAMQAKTIGEAAPQSKTAQLIDALVTTITGRAPTPARKRPSVRAPSPSRLIPGASAPESEDRVSEAMPAAEPAPAPEVTAAPPETLALETEAAAEELAPLDLVEPAPPAQDYIDRAREAALADLHAMLAEKQRRKKIQGNGRLRALAACLLALILAGGVWREQNQSAAALSPSAAAATPLRTATQAAQAAPAAIDQTATYERAVALLRQGDVPHGVATMQSAAEHGSPLAQYHLAKLYELGQGVPASLAVARRWTERAAAGGNVRAMHDLGVYLARGDGGPEDAIAAARWFRFAAERGVADSQYNLAVLYAQGRGVSPNADEALFWFLVAASHGDQAALGHANDIVARLSADEAEQARARAAAFQPTAADPNANPPEASGNDS
ncbi:MAG: AAA family ATPase [Pseudomonadota bacterium]